MKLMAELTIKKGLGYFQRLLGGILIRVQVKRTVDGMVIDRGLTLVHEI